MAFIRNGMKRRGLVASSVAGGLVVGRMMRNALLLGGMGFFERRLNGV